MTRSSHTLAEQQRIRAAIENTNPSRPAIPAETSKAGAGVAHPAPAETFTTQDGTVLRVDGEAA